MDILAIIIHRNAKFVIQHAKHVSIKIALTVLHALIIPFIQDGYFLKQKNAYYSAQMDSILNLLDNSVSNVIILVLHAMDHYHRIVLVAKIYCKIIFLIYYH